MLQNLKKRLIRIINITLSFCLILLGTISTAPHSSALSESMLDMFDQNGIYYYNPEGSITCASEAAPTVAGNTIEEKIWNYFANANITNVSNNPAVIAGIMGNLYQESGYDPFIISENGYLGIYMLGSNAVLKQKVEESYPNYWRTGSYGDTSQYSDQDAVIGAIVIELNYLTNNETNFSQYFIPGISKATNQDGAEGAASYSELFLATVERAINGSDSLTDSGVQKYIDDNMYNGTQYKYQDAGKRANYARDIYNKYAAASTSSSSYSTTGNCLRSLSESFTYYGQEDPQWGSLRFGKDGINGSSGETIEEAGCGPTSFAMIATALLGRDILPSETTDIAGKAGMYVENAGSSWSITKVLADHYGLEYEEIAANSATDAVNKINEHLKNGWMIHTSGSGENPFTSGGHYIAIRGLTSSGKWLIGDSWGPHGGQKNTLETEWDPQKIVNGMSLGNIKAVRAPSATCGQLQKCSKGSTSGGLSEKDAQKLISYFKSDKVNNDGTPWQAGTKWNCTSMVAWFLHNFTSIETAGGNGKDVVNNLKSTHNIPTGKTPKAYSIFSTPEPDDDVGHTGVVIAVNGDNFITLEAYYSKPNVAEVVTHTKNDFKEITFGYLDNVININQLNTLLNKL